MKDATQRVTLRESERVKLRDWYDDSGPWRERMSALYRIVEAIVEKRLGEAPDPDVMSNPRRWVEAGKP